MKVTAVGAKRTMYRHLILDSDIASVQTDGNRVVFNLLSIADPGISKGQFLFTFELQQAEVFALYEQAITMNHHRKIQALEDEIQALKTQLQEER